MKRPLIVRLAQSKVFFPLLAGGTLFQVSLSGCDPTVKDTLLTGIQTSITGLFSAVTSAFFLSLQESTSTTQTVQAAFESLKHWLV